MKRAARLTGIALLVVAAMLLSSAAADRWGARCSFDQDAAHELPGCTR